MHRDAIRRSEKLSTLRKSRKLKFTSKRFVLYIRKNILVESWLRSCIYTVINESPQDMMGSFPFTDIKREMEHSVSEAAVYGPDWRHESMLTSRESTFAKSTVIIHILVMHLRIIFISPFKSFLQDHIGEK